MLCTAAIFIDNVADEDTLGVLGNYKDVDTTLKDWLSKFNIHQNYFTGESGPVVFESCLGFITDNIASNSAENTGQYVRPNLRSSLITMSRHWRFFCSPQGFAGMVPANSRISDRLCVLIGASVPFVLRKQQQHYIIIGEAYVHGFMYGHAIDLMYKGEREKEILIH